MLLFYLFDNVNIIKKLLVVNLEMSQRDLKYTSKTPGNFVKHVLLAKTSSSFVYNSNPFRSSDKEKHKIKSKY